MTPRDPKPPGVTSAKEVLAVYDGGRAFFMYGAMTIRLALEARAVLEEAGLAKLSRMAGRLDHLDACGPDGDCACLATDLLRALARTLDPQEGERDE